jgi:hypothetical protein
MAGRPKRREREARALESLRAAGVKVYDLRSKPVRAEDKMRGHRRGGGGRGSERGDGRRPAAVAPISSFTSEEAFDFGCEIAEEADELAEGNTDLALMGLILASRLHAGSEAIFNAALALSVKQTDWATVEKEHADANDPSNQDDGDEEDADGDEGDSDDDDGSDDD